MTKKGLMVIVFLCNCVLVVMIEVLISDFLVKMGALIFLLICIIIFSKMLLPKIHLPDNQKDSKKIDEIDKEIDEMEEEIIRDNDRKSY